MRTKQKKAIAFFVSLCMSLYCIPLQFLTLVRADELATVKAIFAYDTEEGGYEDFEFLDYGEENEYKDLIAVYVYGGSYTFNEVPGVDIFVDNAEVSFADAADIYDASYVIWNGSIAFDAVTVSAYDDESEMFEDAGDAYSFFMGTVDGRPYCYTLTGDWTVPEDHEFNAQAISGQDDYTFTTYSGIIVNDFQVSAAVIESDIRITEGGQFGCSDLSGNGSITFENGVYVYNSEWFLKWDENEADFVPADFDGNVIEPGRYISDYEVGGFVYDEIYGGEAYVDVFYDNCNWSGSVAQVYIDGDYIAPEGSITYEPGSTIVITLAGIDRYSEVEHIVEISGDFGFQEFHVYDGETIEFKLVQGGKYAIQVFWSDFERQGPGDNEFVLETNENGNGYIDLSDYDMYGAYVRAYDDPANIGHKKFIIDQEVFGEFGQVPFVIVPNEGDTFERFVTDEGEFFADPMDEQEGFEGVLVFEEVLGQWCYEITEVPERPWEPIRIAADFTGGNPGPGPQSNEIWINDHGFRPNVLVDEEFVPLEDNRLDYDALSEMDSITLGFEKGDHDAFAFMIRMDGYSSVVPFDEITDDYYVITVDQPDEGWEMIHEFEIVDNDNTPFNGNYRVEWRGGGEPETSLVMGQPVAFEAGEKISFTAEHNYYAIAIRTNSGACYGLDYSEDDYCEYTPESDEGFSFVFYMTEESFDFDNLDWDGETERDIWFNFNHEGFEDSQVHDYLTITAGGEEVEYFVSGNQVRFVIDKDIEELTFSISDPSVADNYSYRIGEVNDNASEVTVDVDEWNSWLDFEIWFEKFGGGGNEIWINDHGFAVSAFNGEDYVYLGENRLDYDDIEELDSINLRFDMRGNDKIFGIKIRMDGYTLTVPVEEGTDENEGYYFLTLDRPEDGWRTIREIEVMDWNGPFNGQYAVEWRGFEPETSLTIGEPVDFEVGEPITFTVDSDFYALIARTDSGEEFEVSYDEVTNEYSYTPETDEAFSFVFYADWEQYQFDHLDWDWDTECSLWFNFDHGGFDDYQMYDHLDILVDGECVEYYVSGGQVRLVLDQDVNTIRIRLNDPTFEADRWGYWLNGEEVINAVEFDVNVDLHDGDNWIDNFRLYFERDGGGGYEPSGNGVYICCVQHGEDNSELLYSLNGTDFSAVESFEGDWMKIPADIKDAEAIYILAPRGEDDPGNDDYWPRYRQAHITYNETQSVVAMDWTEDGYLLVFNKPGDEWPAGMNIKLTDYSNPCDYEYRYDVHANGNPEITVLDAEGDEIRDEMYSFEPGEPIEFQITNGEPFKVVVELNYAYGESNQIVLTDEDGNGFYSFTPEDHRGFAIKVYTDEAEWEWDHFWPDWSQGQFYFEFRFDHEGFDEISDIVSIDVVGDEGGIIDGMAYGDRMRLILAEGTQGLMFNVDLPDEYDEYRYVINGEEFTEGTEFSVGVTRDYCDDLDLVLCKYNRVGLVLSEIEGINGLQYSTDGENFNDLALVEDPEFPGKFWYVVPYEDIAEATTIFFKIDDPEYGGDDYVQARIMVDDQGCINSVPIGFEDGVYQFSIYREDGWPFMGWLEVNTWYELNYNEYRTVIYGDYNSSPINIMGISTDYDTVNFFQEDDTIEFTVMGGDVYDVLAFYPDSGAEIYFDREVTTDEYGTEIYTYSFTPETNDPFEISIFLTENDYDFWSFRPVEGQKSYEFWVNVNGIEDFDLEDFINFDTDNEGIIDSMFITDGGYKVIYDEEAAVLYIGLDPDKIPEDANFEVISDGEDITEEVIGNDYIIEVPLDGDYVPPLDINIWTDGVWVAGYWFESDEDSPIVNIWYALDDSEEFTLVPSVYDEEYPEDDPKTILNYSEVGEAETITFKFEVEEGFIPKTASIWFGGGRGSELHVAEDDGFYYLVIDTSMVEDQEYDTHIRLMDREEPCDFEYGFELIGRGDVTVNEDPDAFDKYYDYETGEPITFTVEGDIYKVCAYAFGEYIDVEEVNGVYTFTPQDRVVEPTEYSEGYVQPFYFGFYFKIYVTEAEYEYDQTPWPQYPQEYMQIFIGNEEYVTISEQDSVAQTWVGAGRIKVLINDFYNNDTVVLVDIEWPEGCDAVFVNGVEFEDTQYEWKPCLEGNLTIEFLGEEPLTEDPGWHEDEAGNKYYIKDNGQRATGLRDIDGEKYFFDNDGIMQTGFIVTDGTKYFFDNSGKAVAGWRQDGEGNWYYFQEVGVVATGLTKIGKNTFFFDEEGIMQTGLVETEDGTYLFNAGGYMQTGKQVVDGDTYFFGADGKMLTNYWFKMEDGKYNYFGEDGVMVFGTFATIKNSVYYFDADGIMATGWKKISGKYHYFLGGGAMVTGFRTISGKTYLFDDQGVMLTGWQEADGKKYYFESSGAMATGWKKLDGKWYYFDGAMATGLQTISGKKFFFDDQGVMQTGWQTADGQSYYFIDSGEMAADAIVTIESATFYFDADGKIVKNSWISKDGNYYYFGTEGEMLKGWQEIKSKWYYFDENGVMLTGWQKLSSKWYYFEGSGAMVSGWKKLDGKWYYFDGGAMATKWAKIDGKWYYFGTDGIMVTGWQEIGGSWYYFKNGAMVTGTQKIGSKTYVFDSNGVWIG